MCERNSKSLIPMGIIAIVIVALDQISKAMASSSLSPVSPVKVIDSLFDLTLVHNKGAAFGILSNLPDLTRNLVFCVISVIAVGILIYIYKTRPKNNCLTPIAVAMIGGGAVGNFIDRIRFGYVVDFLDFYYKSHHWPTFNIADSAITVGVSVLILTMLFEEWKNAS